MLAAALRAAPRCASRAASAPPRRFFHPEDALRLECIDVNLFRAPKENLWRPVAARGVFGGQIIGQVRNSGLPRPGTRLHELSLPAGHGCST